jgi:hypothetical protein
MRWGRVALAGLLAGAVGAFVAELLKPRPRRMAPGPVTPPFSP